MSAGQEDPAGRLDGAAAAPGLQEERKAALFEFRVYNIIITALALCILIFTGLYCFTVWYNRNRQSKRAQKYESAVTGDEPTSPVTVQSVRRSASFINPFALFKKQQVDREEESNIYYIYSNPLPIGVEEEEKELLRPCGLEEQRAVYQEHEDQNSGGDPDPPVFYMQL